MEEEKDILDKRGIRIKQRETKMTTNRSSNPTLGLSEPETANLLAWISGRHLKTGLRVWWEVVGRLYLACVLGGTDMVLG